jgi:hypothetical protein
MDTKALERGTLRMYLCDKENSDEVNPSPAFRPYVYHSSWIKKRVPDHELPFNISREEEILQHVHIRVYGEKLADFSVSFLRLQRTVAFTSIPQFRRGGNFHNHVASAPEPIEMDDQSFSVNEVLRLSHQQGRTCSEVVEDIINYMNRFHAVIAMDGKLKIAIKYVEKPPIALEPFRALFDFKSEKDFKSLYANVKGEGRRVIRHTQTFSGLSSLCTSHTHISVNCFS